VTKGNAFLLTKEGIKGTVTTPDGKKEASATMQPGAAPQAQAGGGLFGLSTTTTVVLGVAIIGGAILAAVFIPCNRPADVTPGSPNANDCQHGL
jgi:hypothetical protein